MMLWLCLYFPRLPLQVYTRAQSKENTRAILVAAQHRVLCANDTALQQGIKTGQPVATAHALCVDLHLLNRDPQQEARLLQQIAYWCYGFSPIVSLKPPDCVLLEIRGSLTLFKGLSTLLAKLDQGLNERGLDYQQGLGHTPKAAELLARSTPDSSVTIVPSPAYQQQLAQVPLSFLAIPAQQIKALESMGLRRFGEILKLPRAALGRRFGMAFLHYLEQTMGERADPQQPIKPEQKFCSSLFYIEGITDKESLIFPMKRLLTELCQFLRSHQLHCSGLSWHLAELHRPAQVLNLRFSQAQNTLPLFLELSRIKLSAQPLAPQIHSLTLRAQNFTPATTNTRDLLGLTEQNQQQAALTLLDKLKTRLGSDAVYGIRSCAEHIPELAWQVREYRPPSPEMADSKPEEHALRPLWLLPKPEPIGDHSQGLVWHGPLTLVRGPERIESHWWSDAAAQRDYFIARHEQGGIYWVFRDLSSRRWFIQGVFC